jgi:hypothetical protein
MENTENKKGQKNFWIYYTIFVLVFFAYGMIRNQWTYDVLSEHNDLVFFLKESQSFSGEWCSKPTYDEYYNCISDYDTIFFRFWEWDKTKFYVNKTLCEEVYSPRNQTIGYSVGFSCPNKQLKKMTDKTYTIILHNGKVQTTIKDASFKTVDIIREQILDPKREYINMRFRDGDNFEKVIVVKKNKFLLMLVSSDEIIKTNLDNGSTTRI